MTEDRDIHDVGEEKATTPDDSPTSRYVHGVRLHAIAYTYVCLYDLVFHS